MTRSRIRGLISAALATSLVLWSAAAAPAGPPVIEMRSFAFSPSQLAVVAGTLVTWKNQDPEPHTVASVDGKFRSDALDQGDSFSFTFNAPGTYRYVCSIHPQMVGTIVVTAARR